MKEIWKDVPGYEGYYQVSAMGRIRSLDRLTRHGNYYRRRTGAIIKQVPNRNGYLRVTLSNSCGKKEVVFVHRLVAASFVDNPDMKNVVNHKDFNYTNNVAGNLEWVTFCENISYSARHGRFAKNEKWRAAIKQSQQSTPVIGTNICTRETVMYAYLNDCKVDGFQPSCVCNCCKGTRETHKGYTWRYAT